MLDLKSIYMKNMGKSFNVDTKKIASAFKFNMTQEEMARVFQSMMKQEKTGDQTDTLQMRSTVVK